MQLAYNGLRKLNENISKQAKVIDLKGPSAIHTEECGPSTITGIAFVSFDINQIPKEHPYIRSYWKNAS